MIILRQKEYARKDYEGLGEEEKRELNSERKQIAKNLRRDRFEANMEKATNMDRLKHANYVSKSNRMIRDSQIRMISDPGARNMAERLVSGENADTIKNEIINKRNLRYNKALQKSNQEKLISKSKLLKKVIK